jgi:Asp/Glu/hydantoin racemase
MSATIAYLHTSHVLIAMFTELSKRAMPEAAQFHMVDESLIRNTIQAQRLTKSTTRRVIAMVQSARDGGADAAMVTCSSIGPAAALAQEIFDFPVIRVDDAMAQAAVCTGRRIGVAATLRTTLEPTVELLREKARHSAREVEIVEDLCDGAFEAVLSGDTATHDRVLTGALTRLMRDVDVVVLAQASMARVVPALPHHAGHARVLSSPELAVQQARSVLFPGVRPL